MSDIVTDIQDGYYLQITQPTSTTLLKWHTMQNIIDASMTDAITVSIMNSSTAPITIKNGECIVQMIYKKGAHPSDQNKA